MQQIMTNNKVEDDEIQNSQYEDEMTTNLFNPFITSLPDDKEYHYIDILSIVQIINIPQKND